MGRSKTGIHARARDIVANNEMNTIVQLLIANRNYQNTIKMDRETRIKANAIMHELLQEKRFYAIFKDVFIAKYGTDTYMDFIEIVASEYRKKYAGLTEAEKMMTGKED
jgi:hypothetical protein